MNPAPPLLEVRGLRTQFRTAAGVVDVVDGIDFDVRAGETVGLVGESGCGKSVTAMSLVRLVPDPPGRVVAGRVLFNGVDVLSMDPEALRRVRGAGIALVFQEPMSALNPVLPVGEQVAEAIRAHESVGRAEAWGRAVRLLEEVGVPDPASRARDLPHVLSGGLRQRVVIAIALSCGPSLLVADEPTTALDVTVQAQVLELLARERRGRGMGVLLITHDLGVVAQSCERVLVMYAGRIVEAGPTAQVLGEPRHPYTLGLVASMPGATSRGGRLQAIPGVVPAPGAWPSGCRFRDRCGRAVEACAGAVPVLVPSSKGRAVACLRVGGDAT